jgi:hypothetical protein
MGGGLTIEANMASMAAPIAVVMMQVGVDEHNLRGVVRPIHQADVRQNHPLWQLDGEVIDSVTRSREGLVATMRVVQDPTKQRQIVSKGLHRDPARTSQDPDGQDGFFNGPPIHGTASGCNPRDASLKALQGREVVVFLE